jgi:endoglucanase
MKFKFKAFRSKIKLSLFFFVIILQLSAQSKFILVDQFGYRPGAKKVAVIRSAQVGFDASDKYTPGLEYAVINTVTGAEIQKGTITSWNNGATHDQSGDKLWWFDFSNLSTVGEYYILDKTTKERSYNFKISSTVYKDVLKAAFKTFYYQRSGFEKKAQWAEVAWSDGASHIKANQDKNAKPFNDKNNFSREKDLSGGWYDAGDYNKYTAWHASYIVQMLKMYQENKAVWTDDFNIPESGNGIPDLIDEIEFGLEWLKKMQQNDGSALTVVGCSSASPPSAVTGPSYYGNASTYATLKSAEAFALSAIVLKEFPKYSGQISDFIARARSAYNWAVINPSVVTPNNQASNGTQGLAAGNQETDDLGRETAKLRAALYLYMATNDQQYKSYFEANYTKLPLINWSNYISQYFLNQQEILFDYLTLKDRDESIASRITSTTLAAARKQGDFIHAITENTDPYRAFIKDFNWGSNQYKTAYGNFFMTLLASDIDKGNNIIYRQASEGYINYIHGLNPLNTVYLTAMKRFGADKTITQFYHSWFNDKTKWDVEGESQFGPAPGFLVGGPNPKYTKDGCCPSGCGSASNNALCNSISVSPPLDQPPMKAYKDFNDGWPLNSWAISENSNSYQISYIRLLSKFVETSSTTSASELTIENVKIYPNPAFNILQIKLDSDLEHQCTIMTLEGKSLIQKTITKSDTISTDGLSNGLYLLNIKNKSGVVASKKVMIVKN